MGDCQTVRDTRKDRLAREILRQKAIIEEMEGMEV